MGWADDDSKFYESQEIIDLARDMWSEEEPNYDYLDLPTYDGDDVYHGRKVKWDTSRSKHIILVPTKYISMTSENMWYPEHFAALLEAMETEDVAWHPPAARVYRVSKYSQEKSVEYEEEGELEENTGLLEPWDEDEIGQLYVDLRDGNHRALAALLLGEEIIPIIVGENYWDTVRDDEWLEN